jgi:hypothetical protein
MGGKIEGPGKDLRDEPARRQIHHFIGVSVLFGLLYLVSALSEGPLLWVWLAYIAALLHQGFVALVWRLELSGSHITKRLGVAGFYIFGIVFFILLSLRFFITVVIGWATRAMTVIPAIVNWVFLAVFLILALYTIYSVFAFFGVKRALGADHFFPGYRKMPFVREGIFRITPNGMYTFGTLMFFIPGLLFRSDIGLAAGAFNYLSVWVHYWATELPDIRYMYGRD